MKPDLTMNKINSGIFRAYDVRGKYPDELNADTAYAIARGFSLFLKKELKKNALYICVGRDARNSSAELFEAFVKGVYDEGGKVLDVGLVITPVAFFAVSSFPELDGGVNITASHNPNPYNGFKLIRNGGVLVGGIDVLFEIKEIAERFAGTYK